MAEPLCKYFGECGGCSWQNLDYSVQLENKKRYLAGLLKDIFKIDDIKVFSGNEYGYRNRMDFIFTRQGLGFRRKHQWNSVVEIGRCEIANVGINKIADEIKGFFKEIDYFDIKRQAGTFKYAVIRATLLSSSISFVLNEDSQRLSQAVERIEEFAKRTTADNVIITYVPVKADESVSNEFFAVKGDEMLNEIYLGNRFLFHIQGFFQNNTSMAEKMQEYCNGLLKDYGHESTKSAGLLDLYAGVGTFGIINSALFKDVAIVENDANCVKAAELNIKNNSISNAKIYAYDAKQLKKAELKGKLYAIADPPRSGMDAKTIEELNRLNPGSIIYISCNVEQLAKDIPKFKNHILKSVALFDLFPQTMHAEAVAELALKGMTNMLK